MTQFIDFWRPILSYAISCSLAVLTDAVSLHFLLTHISEEGEFLRGEGGSDNFLFPLPSASFKASWAIHSIFANLCYLFNLFFLLQENMTFYCFQVFLDCAWHQLKAGFSYIYSKENCSKRRHNIYSRLSRISTSMGCDMKFSWVRPK